MPPMPVPGSYAFEWIYSYLHLLFANRNSRPTYLHDNEMGEYLTPTVELKFRN